jgi:hypothetical protein
MALEPTKYIWDLSRTDPLGSEILGQGDDHMRLIKGSVLNTFPNFVSPTGQSIKLPVPYTSDELNYLQNQISGKSQDYTPNDKDEIVYVPVIPTTMGNLPFYVDTATKVIKPQPELPPFGQIFESILTEKKLNEYYGIVYSGTPAVPTTPRYFAIMNGQSVSGTTYASLFNENTLPDFTVKGGLFLADLDGVQVGTTDYTKLTVYDSVSYPKITTLSATFNASVLNSYMQSAAAHNHSQVYPTGDGGTSASYGPYTAEYYIRQNAHQSGSVLADTYESAGAVGFDLGKIAGKETTNQDLHYHEYAITFSVEIPDTSTETRPKSYAINYFTRIN